MIATIVLQMILAFNDGFGCEVRGDLYAMPGDLPSLTRTDGCQALIQHYVQDGALHLRSDVHWVVIILPHGGGHQEFAYKWGSEQAWIHGREWLKLSHGPMVGG